MAAEAGRITISIIGAGNVATHLAPALAQVAEVRQVVSRHIESADAIASKIDGCTPEASLSGLLPDSHLYIITTNDDAIGRIAADTPDYPGLWVHTSGSVGMDVFDGLKTRHGSLYPLQTFSKNIAVDLSRVPFLLEATSEQDVAMMERLLSGISRRVRRVDSNTRAALHVAAVFACNFANQMWAEADRLLRDRGLDITYLLPLLEATLGKLTVASPRDAMTGPGRRGDIDVINRHLATLPDDMRPVYATVTRRILREYHPGLESHLLTELPENEQNRI